MLVVHRGRKCSLCWLPHDIDIKMGASRNTCIPCSAPAQTRSSRLQGLSIRTNVTLNKCRAENQSWQSEQRGCQKTQNCGAPRTHLLLLVQAAIPAAGAEAGTQQWHGQAQIGAGLPAATWNWVAWSGCRTCQYWLGGCGASNPAAAASVGFSAHLPALHVIQIQLLERLQHLSWPSGASSATDAWLRIHSHVLRRQAATGVVLFGKFPAADKRQRQAQMRMGLAPRSDLLQQVVAARHHLRAGPVIRAPHLKVSRRQIHGV